MFPALAGVFLTTEPPGKSHTLSFATCFEGSVVKLKGFLAESASGRGEIERKYTSGNTGQRQ